MRPEKTFFGKVMVVTGALLILLCLGSISRAAPPTLDFATYLGGGDSIPFVGGPDWGSPDWGRAVEMDPAGNVYVAVETWSYRFFWSPGVAEIKPSKILPIQIISAHLRPPMITTGAGKL